MLILSELDNLNLLFSLCSLPVCLEVRPFKIWRGLAEAVENSLS